MEISPTRVSPRPADLSAATEEMKQVFRHLEDRYSSRGGDTSRDTGATVDFYSGGGGCGGPAAHSFSVRRPDGSTQSTHVCADRLPHAEGTTISSDGCQVVGQFRLDRAEWRNWRFRWAARRHGLLDPDRPGHDKLSPFYLVEVPLEGCGSLAAPLRRNGYLPQKVLAQLPEQAESLDLGPDGSIAVAQGNRVLRWTPWKGLRPWLEFATAVREVEFLSDGSLAIATRHPLSPNDYCDYHLFRPRSGGPVDLALKEVDPDAYRRLLNGEVAGVRFLQDASVEQKEAFLAASDWLRAPESRYWKPHQALAGPAVLVWEGEKPDLWILGESGATRLGPAGHPDSRRLSLSRQEPPDARFSSDGRFLVLISKPGTEGAPVDLTVWDLKERSCSLVPGVRKVALENDRLTFLAPGNESESVPLDKVPELRERRWYTEARIHDLFDSDSLLGNEGIEVGEDEVKVGRVALPIRKLSDG